MIPKDIHEEGVNYRVRIVVLVEDKPLIGLTNDSLVTICTGCERAVWIDAKQILPEPPEGEPLTGDLNLCVDCMSDVLDSDPESDPDQVALIEHLKVHRKE